MIVPADLESHFVAMQTVACRHRSAFPLLIHLVGNRSLEGNLTISRADPKIALIIQAKASGTLEAEANRLRRGSGSHGEVVFEFPLRAVVDEIDSWVHAGIADLIVGGDIRVPPGRIIADKIIDSSRQRILGRRNRSVIGAAHAQANDLRRRRVASLVSHGQRGALLRDGNRVGRPVRQILDLLRGLAQILLEVER